MRLRVPTLNVRNEAGDPRRTELPRREIRRLRPDLVALPQVRHPDQPARLLDGAGLPATHQFSLFSDHAGVLADLVVRRPPRTGS